MRNTPIYHCVYMIPFGISTAVMASQSCIEWYMNEYETQPDTKFFSGLGKKELLRNLEILLPEEDKYFTQHPHLAISENQRWQNFCDDCVILATLSAFINGSKIVLLHPDSYDPSSGLNGQHEISSLRPSLVKGIGIQHIN